MNAHKCSLLAPNWNTWLLDCRCLNIRDRRLAVATASRRLAAPITLGAKGRSWKAAERAQCASATIAHKRAAWNRRRKESIASITTSVTELDGWGGPNDGRAVVLPALTLSACCSCAISFAAPLSHHHLTASPLTRFSPSALFPPSASPPPMSGKDQKPSADPWSDEFVTEPVEVPVQPPQSRQTGRSQQQAGSSHCGAQCFDRRFEKRHSFFFFVSFLLPLLLLLPPSAAAPDNDGRVNYSCLIPVAAGGVMGVVAGTVWSAAAVRSHSHTTSS